MRIEAVATAGASAALARSVGIVLVPLERVARVDLTIDGVDQIDPMLNAIKGRGGALLREKIIESASDRVIVIADSSKCVKQLGRQKIPVEVPIFASSWVERGGQDMGLQTNRRTHSGGLTFQKDKGKIILELAQENQ